MGIKQIELIPIQDPSPLIPSGKGHYVKAFQAVRTNTTSVVKAVLPAQSSVWNVYFYGSVDSDAATTATLTVTVSDNSGVISTGTVDVKGAGATNALVNMTNLPNIEQVPTNGDLKVACVYAETGGASTVGGPWKVGIEYVV